MVFFRDRLDQPEAEEKGNRDAGALGRAQGHRLPLDSVRLEQRCRPLPYVLPAFPAERIAAIGLHEAGCFDQELFTRPAADRVGMAGAALVLIEQRSETLLLREDMVEQLFAFMEAVQLGGTRANQRSSRLRFRWRRGRASSGE